MALVLFSLHGYLHGQALIAHTQSWPISN